MEPTLPAESGTLDANWLSEEWQQQAITEHFKAQAKRLERRHAQRRRVLWHVIVSVQHERPMVRSRESHRDCRGHRRSSSSSRTSSADPGPDGPSDHAGPHDGGLA